MVAETVQPKTIAGQLAAPFPAHDIEWRVQSCGTKKDGTPWAKVLAYVTARGIMERLDLVFGPGGWQTAYVPGPAGGVVCKLTCFIDDRWVTKEDGAENTDIESVKGGISSALKRAAVSWGIGRYLYRLDEGWAQIVPQGDGMYTGKTKEGTWFGWNPPVLPSWAIAYEDNAPASNRSEVMPAAKPQTRPAPAPSVSTPAPARTPASTVKEQPSPAPSRPATTVPRDAGTGWREFIVPKFIKKYAGKEMQEMDPRDLAWWAENYEPKPYKGSISPQDVAFKAALLAGHAEVNGAAMAETENARRHEPTPEEEANLAPAGSPSEDVPF